MYLLLRREEEADQITGEDAESFPLRLNRLLIRLLVSARVLCRALGWKAAGVLLVKSQIGLGGM
jgi:hypothetical protein